MQTQVLSSFSQESQAASQVILGPYAFIQGIRNLGSAFVFYLLLLLATPLLGYLWFILWRARKKLSKTVHTQIDLTSANYSKLRAEYAMLKQLRHKIKSMELPDMHTIDPFILRFFQVRAFVHIFESRITSLEEVFNSLNPTSTSSDHILMAESEDDLWRNRNKAYDYLI